MAVNFRYGNVTFYHECIKCYNLFVQNDFSLPFLKSYAIKLSKKRDLQAQQQLGWRGSGGGGGGGVGRVCYIPNNSFDADCKFVKNIKVHSRSQ